MPTHFRAHANAVPVALIFVGLFLAAPLVQASYLPGATLDPSCLPTDPTCIVTSLTASSTANSFPYYAANGSVLSATSTLTLLTNGNVGIGTTSPYAKLSVTGNIVSTGTISGDGSLLTSLDATALTSSTTERDFYGNYFLRNWNNQIAGIKTANATTTPAVILYMGDSWTAGESITAPLRATLQNKLGNAGSGYISLGTIDGPPSGATISSSGTWTTINGSGNVGADLYAANTTDSATPAQKVITTIANSFVLHYLTQSGGGQFSYSIDGVGTTTVDTNGGSTVFASVTVSTTNAQHILRIQDVTAGTAGVTLFGVDAQITGVGGARVEMIGHSGAQATTYNNVNTTTWKAAMTALNPNTVFIMLGVNDANAGVTPTQQKANMATLVASTQAALPNADIVLIPQPQNGNTPTYDQTLYDYAQEDLARANGYGFIDLNKYMGPYGTNKYGFWKTNFHPTTLGGQMIADIVERILVNGMDNFLNTTNFTSSDGTNTFIGKSIGNSITTGNSNTFLGYGVGQSITTGSLNTALGYSALNKCTTCGNNVAMGRLALYNNVTGTNNTAIGWNAQYNGTNAGNTSLGASTLFTNVTGTEETAIGNSALYQATREQNTAVGNNAGYNITAGYRNTFLGDNAGYTDGTTPTSATITNSTAIGFNAQVTASNSLVLGGIGAYAVNVGIGTTSPYAPLSVVGQVVGSYFTATSTTATSTFNGDISIGGTTASLPAGSVTRLNVANSYTGGTVYGIVSQQSSGIPTTGYGVYSAPSGTTAYGVASVLNNVIGVTTGYGLYSSSAISGIGITTAYGAYIDSFSSATNNYGVYIASQGSGTNKFALYAAGTTDKSYFGGNVGIGTTSPYSLLTVWGPDTASTSPFRVVNSASTTVFAAYDSGNITYSGSSYQSSDKQLKTDIAPLDASSSLTAILGLNPVSYTRLDQPGEGTNLGFIAQDVQQIFPELVSTTSPTTLTPNGTLTLNYVGLIAPIVEAIKELAGEVSSLAATVVGFAQSFTSQDITATQRLCVGSTCITEGQLKMLLQNSGQQGNTSQTASANTIIITDVPTASNDSTATTTAVISAPGIIAASSTPDTTATSPSPPETSSSSDTSPLPTDPSTSSTAS